MKIGIITQPLQTNYGGLLQNYALQQVFKKLGHEVYTINRTYLNNIYSSRIDKYIIFHIKGIIKKYLRRRYFPTKKEIFIIKKECISFIKNHIQTTNIIKTLHEFIKVTVKYKFNALIVGSDQVWRPQYSPNIMNDFLDFCQENKDIKRIAYAASFGVDNWEFNEEQTKECSRLAKLFNAISVREASGITLCKEYLGVDAIHVLDPTMLLEKEEYIKLVEQNCEQKSQGELFCYILDNNENIQNTISSIEKKLSLKSFQVKAKKTNSTLKRKENIKDYIIPSPTKWLRAFMDAKMVFTDSFHGCVFSIIFNKPFWVIGNKERGNARFKSLLKLFKLEDRRICLKDINNTDLTTEIDWNKVNTIKKEWQQKSLNFIKENL